MGRVCHGPSLYGPSLLWAEFVMGRVCYGPSCPVTKNGHGLIRFSLFKELIEALVRVIDHMSNRALTLEVCKSLSKTLEFDIILAERAGALRCLPD